MYELKNYFTGHGEKTVLVGPVGRKLMPILMIDGTGLVVRKVPIGDSRYMRDVRENKKRRGIGGTIRQYRAIGRKLGMSKAAKAFLIKANNAANLEK